MAESIAKVPNDVILHAQNRSENLRSVNAHCFLKAKIYRNATARLGLFMSCQVFPAYSASVVGTGL